MQVDVSSAAGSGLPSTLTLLDGIRPVVGDYLPYIDGNGAAALMRVSWCRLYPSATGGSSMRVGCESVKPPPPPPP